MSQMKTFIILSICICLFGCMVEKSSYPGPDLADKQIAVFSKEVEQEKKFILVGSGGRMMNCISELSLDFDSCYPMRLSIAEARKLIIEMTEKLKNEVNANEAIRPYLSQYPIDQKNVEIAISFLDAPHRRVPEDFVARVRQSEGIVYYSFFDHKTGFFSDRFVREPYEEALRLAHQEKCHSKTALNKRFCCKIDIDLVNYV